MSRLPIALGGIIALGGVIAGFILDQLAELLWRHLIPRWVRVPVPASAAATPEQLRKAGVL